MSGIQHLLQVAYTYKTCLHMKDSWMNLKSMKTFAGFPEKFCGHVCNSQHAIDTNKYWFPKLHACVHIDVSPFHWHWYQNAICTLNLQLIQTYHFYCDVAHQHYLVHYSLSCSISLLHSLMICCHLVTISPNISSELLCCISSILCYPQVVSPFIIFMRSLLL